MTLPIMSLFRDVLASCVQPWSRADSSTNTMLKFTRDRSAPREGRMNDPVGECQRHNLMLRLRAHFANVAGVDTCTSSPMNSGVENKGEVIARSPDFRSELPVANLYSM